MASKFAKVLGIIFIILGIVGFFMPMENIFDLTVAHNIVHLLSGIIALAVSSNEAKSAMYAKVFGIVYLLVAVIGLFVTEIAGLVLLPADNVLHFIIAFASIYVGFASPAGKAQRKVA
ncbi:DUF4383 domain-containing protein [Virgibacillus necropolis]|uniref:DUF4383 domain-containing protein n=1 Tax=Virgibacillus necropolis TaxID=163877 RepID=A0A221M7B8_9BACI|nr:DUF4383 domain-containing protein [Virgibacillus necropolis]ASN03529.1 hypothetical protein CFK40_00075 [Virgibacillus necropolis]